MAPPDADPFFGMDGVVALMGDVMLGRGVREALAAMTPEEPWGDVLPLLRSASARILNLECAVTRSERRWMRTPKIFHFRADPVPAVRVLEAASIDACSLANNHSLDFEVEGLEETISTLDRAGIGHAGAGPDLASARRPALLPGGIALVSCTDNEPDFAADGGWGTFYLPVSTDAATLARVESAIAAARRAGARTVIFADHWGPNMVERPPPHFRAFAREVIDRGADVFFGHSAHLTQGVEIHRGRPILYDTGDFLDDYAVDPVLRNDRSCLFLLRLEDGAPVGLTLVPVSLGYARVEVARGAERRAILDRMDALSGELGTALREEAGALAWGRAAPR
ncbi:MAG TPA: CapA family protein [Vulgatibacter sp.]|nr:CapA family protein [Vulgatibacter sp.]